jgi:hypothetical protein
MLIDTWNDYYFFFRSNGVVVLKGKEYIGFYDTFDEAFNEVTKL